MISGLFVASHSFPPIPSNSLQFPPRHDRNTMEAERFGINSALSPREIIDALVQICEAATKDENGNKGFKDDKSALIAAINNRARERKRGEIPCGQNEVGESLLSDFSALSAIVQSIEDSNQDLLFKSQLAESKTKLFSRRRNTW